MQIQHMHAVSVQKLDGQFAAKLIIHTVLLWRTTGGKVMQGHANHDVTIFILFHVRHS